MPVGQLVLGALTTVFIGIAAQRALGNVFAGLVLLVARPFKVGDAIRLQRRARRRNDGIVTDIGITYVRFDTDGSVMSIPSSQYSTPWSAPSRPSLRIPSRRIPRWPRTASRARRVFGQPQPRPAGPA